MRDNNASSKNRQSAVDRWLPVVKEWLVGSRFQPSMEAAFQQEMAQTRRRRAEHTGWVAVVLYIIFSVNDPVMLPDAYKQAWLVRAAAVPFMMLGILGATKLPTVFMRDFSASAAIVVAAASLAWIGNLSHHPNAAHYHTGIVLVALFGNIALSMRRRNAVITSIIMMVIYAVCLSNIDMIASQVRFNIWMVFFSTVVISLLANFQMDRDRRIAFSARSREVELLMKLSQEDALTQLANRRELDHRLEIEWEHARRNGRPLAMILIDVDYFKYFNDHYGHPAGDRCLQQVAAALKSVPQRSIDLVARFGGEEFVVLLPNTTASDAARIAERMRQAILAMNMPHAASQVAPIVSASFGVAAVVPAKQQNCSTLLAETDAALYRAKHNGRNQVAVHDPLLAVPLQ